MRRQLCATSGKVKRDILRQVLDWNEGDCDSKSEKEQINFH
jgi:hypothetical protein